MVIDDKYNYRYSVFSAHLSAREAPSPGENSLPSKSYLTHAPWPFTMLGCRKYFHSICDWSYKWNRANMWTYLLSCLSDISDKPAVVSSNATISDVICFLQQKKYLPEIQDVGFSIYISGKVSAVSRLHTMKDLGISAMSHLHLRMKLLGGGKWMIHSMPPSLDNYHLWNSTSFRSMCRQSWRNFEGCNWDHMGEWPRWSNANSGFELCICGYVHLQVQSICEMEPILS